MTDPVQQTILPEMRAGDHVYHEPSGETWVLGRVTEEHVYPAGWPPCRAERHDCTLVKPCTDDQHNAMKVAWARRGAEYAG